MLFTFFFLFLWHSLVLGAEEEEEFLLPQEQDTHPRTGKTGLRTETEGKVICFKVLCARNLSFHGCRFQLLSRKSAGQYLGAKVGAHKPPLLRRGFADSPAGSPQQDPSGLGPVNPGLCVTVVHRMTASVKK